MPGFNHQTPRSLYVLPAIRFIGPLSGIPAWRFNLVFSIALATVYNVPFWRGVLMTGAGKGAHGLLFVAGLGIVVAAVLNVFCNLFAYRGLHKVLVGVTLIVASLLLYFMSSYGVMVDKTMLENVLQTDAREVGELISVDLLGYLLLLGIVPVLLLKKLRLRYEKPVKQTLLNMLVIAGSMMLLILVALMLYKDFAPFFRMHRDLRLMLNPISLVSAANVELKDVLHHDREARMIAGDAYRAAGSGENARKDVVVLVVGETARAQNFSLGGYGRNTNPELGKKDIIYFSNTTSCGTSTAVSLPCMFSQFPRSDYSDSRGRNYESLLDVADRTGVRVYWVDNNSGCKGVCDRVGIRIVEDDGGDEYCNETECFDETLVAELDRLLDGIDRDTLIVLHQKGSHGPAYYRRVPPGFKRFTPVCETEELRHCSEREIVNAYDNTILYTDHVLAGVIDRLDKASDRFNTAMIYMSDHGESLGESGLYLHGAPYLLAPPEQKRVPFALWLSAPFVSGHALDESCLRDRSAVPVSHDNLFHTVLSLFDIQTAVYQPTLDITSPCRMES